MPVFLGPILTWLGNLLGGPFATAAVNAYRAKLDSENSAEKTAADLAARELAVQQAELQAQQQLKAAEVGRWYEPEKLFAYSVVVFFAKVLIWDKALGQWTHGHTDGLDGFALSGATMVMSFYVGRRGIENVAAILKRK